MFRSSRERSFDREGRAALLVAFASGIVVTGLGEFFGGQLGLGPLGEPFTILSLVMLVRLSTRTRGVVGSDRVLSHLLVVTDSVLLLWLAARVLSCQILRFPRAVLAAAR